MLNLISTIIAETSESVFYKNHSLQTSLEFYHDADPRHQGRKVKLSSVIFVPKKISDSCSYKAYDRQWVQIFKQPLLSVSTPNPCSQCAICNDYIVQRVQISRVLGLRSIKRYEIAPVLYMKGRKTATKIIQG